MKVSKMLASECIWYVAHLVEKTQEIKLEPKDIRAVKHFMDIFSKDLSGLPPKRETSFEVELLSGSAPISKAPYQIAPAKHKELQAQLQELLDKGFIHPSYSP